MVGAQGPVLYTSWWQAQPAVASPRFFVPVEVVVASGPGLLRSQHPLTSHAYMPAWPELEGPVLQAVWAAAQWPLQQAP